MVEKAEELAETLLVENPASDDLVDAFERVVDENVMDEEHLVQMAVDLRDSPEVIANMRILCAPRKWWEKWKWWDRRDTMGKLEKQVKVQLQEAVPWLKKAQVIEVMELVAADQSQGE